jgi:(1->4)-alpha-D-glucan 1-alpha-D-glucosylmutase
MALNEAQSIPQATYRVQLHAHFTFSDLEGLVPYLHELGISDCYCSPILFSTPGSTHGYDVSDYRKLDPELGGEPAFERLSRALGEVGMGVLLDFVPNHMGISGPFNPWWEDVLESGQNSPYARFFDVHWNSHLPHATQRILVPILEDHYGSVLEQGKLKIQYASGGLRVAYGDVHFPLSPPSYAKILSRLAADPACPAEFKERLGMLIENLRSLRRIQDSNNATPAETYATRLATVKKELAALLDRETRLRALLEANLEVLNGTAGEPQSFNALDELLDEQHYRLARWKAGAHETNYRRFFAVDTLIGLRMENPEVFHESHLLLGLLLREKRVRGLRIDHVDGLWDPLQYLQRLQTLAQPAESAPGPKPLYVLVEKILALDETLPASWPVHGTTGYEFMTQLGQVLTDPSAEGEITDIYRVFTGENRSFEDIVYQNKRLVLEELFANAVNNLASSLHSQIFGDRRWRDLTLHELTVVIREIMASLSIYRTYRRLGEPVTPQDQQAIERAYEIALAKNPRIDPQPFAFVRDVITGAYPGPYSDEQYRARLANWVLNFQQYTGAVMAKAVEDTSFYVYNRFIALNEVGGDPACFGTSIDRFHAHNQKRALQSPHTLLSTSTHDTKLSEDVRARLHALSEIPHEWQTWIHEWQALNRRHKTVIDGVPCPEPNEEYRLYQILLGAWPIDDALPNDTFRERIRAYHRKAINEAKVHTTWLNPNDRWLEAGDRFIDALLDSSPSNAFLRSFRPKAARIAHLGMVNSVAQLALKICSPGVPDIYQGNESWDFSLVDPDNRRPVNFAALRELLQSVKNRSPGDLLQNWRDGAVKLWVTQKLLCFRREHAALFAQGDYRLVPTHGRFAENIIAFARTHENEQLLVVVPRLSAKLGSPPLGHVWDDTGLRLTVERMFRDVLTGREIKPSKDLFARDLFAEFPLAVLQATA